MTSAFVEAVSRRKSGPVDAAEAVVFLVQKDGASSRETAAKGHPRIGMALKYGEYRSSVTAHGKACDSKLKQHLAAVRSSAWPGRAWVKSSADLD